MLNPFPSLLTYSFFAPTILRIVAACVFLMLARTHWKKQAEIKTLLMPIAHGFALSLTWLLIAIETAVGAALLIGFGVQIAAIVGTLLALKSLIIRPRSLQPLSHSAGWLLLAVCLSLVFLGAGAFAFDIPL